MIHRGVMATESVTIDDEVPPATVQGMAGFHIPDDWNFDTMNNVLANVTDGNQLMPWSPDQFEAAINVAPPPNNNNKSNNNSHISNKNHETTVRHSGSNEGFAPSERQSRRSVVSKLPQIVSDVFPRRPLEGPRTSGDAQDQQYPVLHLLLPALREFMPDYLSFSLLEAYFETWPLHGAPKNPLVPSSVFQKQAFLDKDNPRPSTNVLLASMLWLAAQNADVPALSASLGRRKYVRRKLLQLTTQLLKPLSEVAFSGYEGMADTTSHETALQYLDECMAYVHLAMVTSASAFTRASLRWWNMAFSLAREIDLHQPSKPESARYHVDPRITSESQSSSRTSILRAEERKRVWWFLYTMDRHISFLFNKPLSLLDSQCSSLERPLLEISLQGDIEQSTAIVSSGPWYCCTGTDFFQFFTPLMALLGETVYFTLAQNHPRFGISVQTTNDWSNWRVAIREKLDDYQNEIETMRDPEVASRRAGSLSSQESNTSVPRVHRDQDPRSIVVFLYAEFLIDVFHIILAGKWDPQTLLEQHDNWLGSKEFGEVVEHAVNAAATMRELFDIDPGLRFMPFYLGIYLFHVSLPLVLVVDRKHQEVSEQFIIACDTFIRAHEICISHTWSESLVRQTLLHFQMSKANSSQVAMLNVLRTAKTEMQGKIQTDVRENAVQRRRLLQKFDWTSEGRGVAL
ncbi:hypothetical protein D6D01_00072 [Aureobasidium pullulans]|uniref:Xylanolytic transcriptional activator regulatory domain-containing protein n=1 Tax=Aureobasidium pullulans TaxID=5580 RepID=A0A4S9M4Q1_AURPU|nr:hypothetical protein D6D01_00072 [Aureobasidium pullulans]